MASFADKIEFLTQIIYEKKFFRQQIKAAPLALGYLLKAKRTLLKILDNNDGDEDDQVDDDEDDNDVDDDVDPFKVLLSPSLPFFRE